MGLKTRIFAATYDRMSADTEEAGLREQRRELLGQAHGCVLEIGGGTGANLPFYGEAVTSPTVTEPEEPMARWSRWGIRASANDLGSRVEMVRA